MHINIGSMTTEYGAVAGSGIKTLMKGDSGTAV
jgi:hypothetical protein